MANFIVGAVMMLSFFLLYNYTKKKELKLNWWHWLLTILGFLYVTLVLEIIVSFLDEGTQRAALVMGLMLGIVAIIWGVLLGRFVFLSIKSNHSLIS